MCHCRFTTKGAASRVRIGDFSTIPGWAVCKLHPGLTDGLPHSGLIVICISYFSIAQASDPQNETEGGVALAISPLKTVKVGWLSCGKAEWCGLARLRLDKERWRVPIRLS